MAIDTGDTTARQEQSQSGLADQLRTKASTALSQQKDRATQGLGSIVDAVRNTGRQLGDNNQSGIAGYVNNAADSLQRWTETLQHKDVGEIVEDVQRFGRRQPALFIGLSLGAGLLGARFLKSSRGGAYASSYRDASFGFGERDSHPAQRSTGIVRETHYGTSDVQSDLTGR
jgi:hypothetical protein